MRDVIEFVVVVVVVVVVLVAVVLLVVLLVLLWCEYGVPHSSLSLAAQATRARVHDHIRNHRQGLCKRKRRKVSGTPATARREAGKVKEEMEKAYFDDLRIFR
jgi:hypothetical protein